MEESIGYPAGTAELAWHGRGRWKGGICNETDRAERSHVLQRLMEVAALTTIGSSCI